MTKKEYLIIAGVLNRYWESDSYYQAVNTKSYKDGLIESFCVELGKDNPAFDEKLFTEACGRNYEG